MPNLLKHLTNKEKDGLFDALNYMKMEEIKDFCHKHSIPVGGKKGAILKRIKYFLMTGKILQLKGLPEISKAQFGKSYPLNIDILGSRKTIC